MNGIRVVVSGWRDGIWSEAGQIMSGEVCRDVTWIEILWRGFGDTVWVEGLWGVAKLKVLGSVAWTSRWALHS